MSTSRISIDVTPEQHRQLKALAAVKGQSIKDYVLDRTIGRGDEAKAMKELEKLLDARIQESREKGPSKRTIKEIFEDAKKRSRAKP